MKKNKKYIHIIGGGLYGCLLAHQLLKKNYNIIIFEKSNELISSFDYIDRLKKIDLGEIIINNFDIEMAH